MEEDADDLSFFFGIAAAVKKKGGGAQAMAWLRSLAEFHDVGDGSSRTRVLLEIARMSPTDAAVRKELTATLKNRFAGHPALSAVLAKFPLDKAPDPSEVAGRIARWLSFEPNAIYFMPGRGAGRLVELNPALDVMRLEVGGARVPLSLVSAEKNLVPLPPDHFLRRKVEDGPGLVQLAENEPAEALHLLLSSFGRSLTLQEVKDHFAGVVPEDRWSGILDGGAQEPPGAGLGKLEVGRGQLERERRRGRGERSSGHFSRPSRPRASTSRASTRSARRIWRLTSPRRSPMTRAASARRGRRSPGSSRRRRSVSPRGSPRPIRRRPCSRRPRTSAASSGRSATRAPARRRSSRFGRAVPTGRKFFIDQIGREEDSRVLTTLFDALGDRAADLSRRILRSPRSAPRAFVWLCERRMRTVRPSRAPSSSPSPTRCGWTSSRACGRGSRSSSSREGSASRSSVPPAPRKRRARCCTRSTASPGSRSTGARPCARRC